MGLDFIDHKMLNAMIKSFRGGPVGLDTIAATIGESQTIEDVYEPYLLQIGFLRYTPRTSCNAHSLSTFRHSLPEDRH